MDWTCCICIFRNIHTYYPCDNKEVEGVDLKESDGIHRKSRGEERFCNMIALYFFKIKHLRKMENAIF